MLNYDSRIAHRISVMKQTLDVMDKVIIPKWTTTFERHP